MRQTRNTLIILLLLLTSTIIYAQDGIEERDVSAVVKTKKVVKLYRRNAFNNIYYNKYLGEVSTEKSGLVFPIGWNFDSTKNFGWSKGYLEFDLYDIPKNREIIDVKLILTSVRINDYPMFDGNLQVVYYKQIGYPKWEDWVKINNKFKDPSSILLEGKLNNDNKGDSLSSEKFTKHIKSEIGRRIALIVDLKKEETKMNLNDNECYLQITYEVIDYIPDPVVDCNTKINGEKITSNKNYTGCTIQVINNTTISNKAKVSMIAEESVVLKDPFKAEEGTNVSIKIQPKVKSELRSEAVVVEKSIAEDLLLEIDKPTLGQNIPNPFTSITEIPLFIPDNINKAQLVIYSMSGRKIDSINIIRRGNSNITLDSSKFHTNTIYLYCLIVDGKIVDTKKFYVK